MHAHVPFFVVMYAKMNETLANDVIAEIRNCKMLDIIRLTQVGRETSVKFL